MELRPIILALFLLLSTGRVGAEEIVFEMSVFGIRFGTMVVTRTLENDSTELYTVHAKGKTDFLFMQREEESKYRVRYRNGMLYSSEYTYLNKGETEKWANITQVDGQYRIETDESVRMMKELTDYSLIRFYFEPELKRSRIFCEEDCSFSAMQRDPATNKVEINCKDGSRSTYQIKDGRIEQIEIHLAVATVKMKRVK